MQNSNFEDLSRSVGAIGLPAWAHQSIFEGRARPVSRAGTRPGFDSQDLDTPEKYTRLGVQTKIPEDEGCRRQGPAILEGIRAKAEIQEDAHRLHETPGSDQVASSFAQVQTPQRSHRGSASSRQGTSNSANVPQKNVGNC